MAHWLIKTEPNSWSWEQQVKKGDKGEAWTGVRNFTAQQNMMKMKKGERVFFYHSNIGKEIVGIAEVSKAAYPDPTDSTGTFMVVDLVAVEKLPKAVTLVAVKAEPRLKDMALVRFSRLSVQPVTEKEWGIVCEMGGLG